MFRSLRTKLAIAFAAITVLSIAGVGIGMLFLLHDREVQAATQRVGDLLPPESARVGMLAAQGSSSDRIAGYLRQRAAQLEQADQLHVRFIMLDASSQVVVDTDNKLKGTFTGLASGSSGRHVPDSYRITAYREGPTRWVVYQQPSGSLALASQHTLTPTTYDVLMLVPAASLNTAWTDLAPRLLVAGFVALLASLTVALLIARSITRPLVRITQASEAMAQGEYDQRIPVHGRDEVGRLATSFNGMATQVSTSHRMMRDLLANVAHELKTPLTSIQGFSQALADGVLHSPDEYATAARIINEESERMRRLVNDLLYLSQIESGEVPLERRSVEVVELLNAAAERVQWELSDSGKVLELALPAGDVRVDADARRLDQVIANLLDNAIRHTPAGGHITLRGTVSGEQAIIEVHNSGSYIPPDELERIFERFYQVDRSRRRDGNNGGLGLAIAREIMHAHGGELSAESDPIEGTTFRLALPLIVQPLRLAEAAAPDSRAPISA